MKKLLKYTGLLLCSWFILHGCQKESLEIDRQPLPLPGKDGATIALVPTLAAHILQDNEIVPMTRTENLIRTRLTNLYHTVIIKKTDNKWIVDTLIIGRIDTTIGNDNWPSTIDVYDMISLPKIRLALRPGTYKAGFFLNANNQTWNPDIKPGFVVAETEDITPHQHLPVAFTYSTQTMGDYSDFGRYMLFTREPFAGWTSFTIDKNDTLQQTELLPEQKLTLTRRATRFRYLLKDTTVKATLQGSPFDLHFGNYEFFFDADFQVPESTPFCQGLNILGGGYYPKDSVCTSLKVHISAPPQFYPAPGKPWQYHMPIPANSRYPYYHILMDEYYPDGIECNITNIHLSGQSGEPIYIYDKKIHRTFRLNRISGVIFEPSPREAAKFNSKNPRESTFYIEENTEADAVELFNPYFELNPKK